MPFKNLEARREHYQKNKDKINAKRREYNSRPEIKEKKRKQEKEWRDNNKDKLRKINKIYQKKYRDKMKFLVLEYYGNKCSCCGESNPLFLSIDHVNGEGTKHRIKIHRKINYWLVKNNFPKDYQILCFNCNWGRYNNGGICPHKEKSNSTIL